MATTKLSDGEKITTLDTSKMTPITDANGKLYYIIPADHAKALMELMSEATELTKGLMSVNHARQITRCIASKSTTSYTNFASIDRKGSAVLMLDFMSGNRFIADRTSKKIYFSFHTSHLAPVISYAYNINAGAYSLWYKLDGDIVRFYCNTSVNSYSYVNMASDSLVDNLSEYLTSTDGLTAI